jgi:hypothetical protein
MPVLSVDRGVAPAQRLAATYLIEEAISAATRATMELETLAGLPSWQIEEAITALEQALTRVEQ